MLVKRKFKFWILFLLLFLALAPFIFAVPPQTTTASAGLEIRYPPFEWVEINGDFEFPFHIYSLETGLSINESAFCVFHLYNNHGEHELELFTDVVEHDYDYEFEVGADNFTAGMSYSASVYCECSSCSVNPAYDDLGGFVAFSFDVRHQNYISWEECGFILLMMVLNSFLFAFIGFNIKERNKNLKGESRLPYLRLFFIGMSILNTLLAVLFTTISSRGNLMLGVEIYLSYIGFILLVYLIGVLEVLFFSKLVAENKEDKD